MKNECLIAALAVLNEAGVRDRVNCQRFVAGAAMTMQPLERVEWGPDNYRMRDDYVAQFVAQGMTPRQARKRCDDMFPPNVWENGEYQVIVHEREMGSGFLTGCVLRKLSIQRRDGGAVQDWRDLQAIKNQLCGPEYEAIELYPAESRVVDTQNRFHLYVLLSHNGQLNPRFPFGWTTGDKERAEDLGSASVSASPFRSASVLFALVSSF